jgi:pimeloyl-ACP methyl ester carboxylesterase
MRYAATLVLSVLLLPPLQAQPKAFDSDGVRISYLDQGAGEAVVLLHGFTASAEEAMAAAIPCGQAGTDLEGYRVLAPDLRGHGRSDKPHNPKMYGTEMVEDVVRLLDHAKVKKAHVVGYSMGAFVAGKLLVSHPDRLLSVTFGGGGPLCEPSPALVKGLDDTADSLAKGKGIGPLIDALIPPGQPKPSPVQVWALNQVALAKNDQKALAAVLRRHADWHVTVAELKAKKVPVQFIHGSLEVPGLTDIITRASGVWPGANVVVVPNGDHASTFATPQFRQAVVSFLRLSKGGPGQGVRSAQVSAGRSCVPAPTVVSTVPASPLPGRP